MDYKFFDYKDKFVGYGSDQFCTAHIVAIVLAIIATIALAFVFIRLKDKTMDKFLKVMSIIVATLEIIYVLWDMSISIKYNLDYFVKEGLSIYTCSLFIYTLLIGAWSKGKIREITFSFVATLGMVSGFVGIILCNGLNSFAFWTFGTLYSFFFHFEMLFVGIIVLVTRTTTITWKSIIYAYIPILVLSVIAIPIDYIFKADYMQVYAGIGVPLYEGLAQHLANMGMRYLYTIIMMVTYIPLLALIVASIKLVYLCCNKMKNKKTSY